MKSLTIVLLAGLLLVSGCTGGQRSTDSHVVLDERITAAAMDTVIRFNQSGMRESALPAEIPGEYWAPEIEGLEPQKIYWHNNNLAIVLRDSGRDSDGVYICAPFSSYLPGSDTIQLTLGRETYVFRVVD